MISSYLTMQNAILAQNTITNRMMQNTDKMLSMATAGYSQPLKPSFTQAADSLELQNKADETKITVLQKLAESIEAGLGAKIKRSTPKYGGLTYKA